MKHEKLAEALSEIQDEFIAEAAEKKQRHTWRWTGAVAAALAAAIAAGIIFGVVASRGKAGPASLQNPVITDPLPETAPTPSGAATLAATGLVAKPEYPQMVQIPGYSSENFWEDYQAWQAGLVQQQTQSFGYASSLFRGSASVFLNSSSKNQVYSPANVYMALALLAEATGGETRQEILELLDVKTIEDLREDAQGLWNAHYCDDGATKLLLANSLWLDDTLPYKADTANTLAESYYASVYHGDLGSQEMNGALRAWLNENTGGLLQEQAAGIELDDRTLLALASTIHYKVKWDVYFNEALTKEGVFHSPEGEQTVEYMYSSFTSAVYEGIDCRYVSVPLKDGCQMWLILPNEGCTPQDVLEAGGLNGILSNLKNSAVPPSVDVNLQLPKFDVASETDLREGLETLGIAQAFSPMEADFSGIADEQLYLSQVDHAARVKIDEEGIEAAAYTIMVAPGAGAPIEREEVDFIIDRPFLFVIEGRNNVPLFIGVVNEP